MEGRPISKEAESAASDRPPHTHRLGDLEGIENFLLAHRLDLRSFVARKSLRLGLGSLGVDLLIHSTSLFCFKIRGYPLVIIPRASNSSRPAFISAATGAPSDKAKSVGTDFTIPSISNSPSQCRHRYAIVELST